MIKWTLKYNERSIIKCRSWYTALQKYFGVGCSNRIKQNRTELYYIKTEARLKQPLVYEQLITINVITQLYVYKNINHWHVTCVQYGWFIITYENTRKLQTDCWKRKLIKEWNEIYFIMLLDYPIAHLNEFENALLIIYPSVNNKGMYTNQPDVRKGFARELPVYIIITLNLYQRNWHSANDAEL